MQMMRNYGRLWNSSIAGNTRKSNTLLFIIYFLFAGIVGFALDSTKPLLLISQVSGVYNQDIVLKVETLESGLIIRFAFRDNDKWGPSIIYKEPILLKALSGEEREYHIKIFGLENEKILEEHMLYFKIDKQKPIPPEIKIIEDNRPEEITVFFQSGRQEKIVYSLNKPVRLNGLVWDRSYITLKAQGKTHSEYFIQSFSQDKAGNRSSIKSLYCTLHESCPELNVLSPMPGSFANRQMLYIRSRDMKWIKYTLDGSDPVDDGLIYTKPYLIKFTGDLRLRVVGIPGGKNKKLLRREVSFQVLPEEKPSLVSDIESGMYKRGLKVRISHSPDTGIFYSLSERTPEGHDLPVPDTLSLDSLPAARKYIVLRLRALQSNGCWGREYRYFYLIDRKKPLTPQIILKGSSPINGPTKVEIVSYDDMPIYYTLDGSQPDANSPRYEKAFIITPENAREAGLTIRARAGSPSGIMSDTASLKVQVDTVPPNTPEVTLSSTDPGNKHVAITVKKEVESRAVFEVSTGSREPSEINLNSPEVREDMILSIPYGSERDFKFRFASIDSAGNISESKKISVRLDRQPPACPLLKPPPARRNFDSNLNITLEGESRIYYEITHDGTVPRDPSVNSPVFEDKIFLKGSENSIVHYYIKLLCQDNIGNLSEVYGPFYYTIDLHPPRFPEFTGLEDGGFYNTKNLKITFKQIDRPIFYTFSDDGSEPPDPDKNSLKISGDTIFFKGEDDREKQFRVKMVPFSSNLERRGDIVSLQFTIDLKPPDHPEITGFENRKRYNKPVVVSIIPASRGDLVYISYTTSESILPDPVQHGELYTEPLNFDVEAGKEIKILLRAAALDRAGNRIPDDQYASFILDKKPPEDPEAHIFPESGLVKDAVTISFQAKEGRIYYELSTDGSMPSQPGIASHLYKSPIVMRGKANQEITYKIIARAVDELENISPGNRVYTFTVDRIQPLPPKDPDIERYGPETEEKYLIGWTVPFGHRLYYRIERPFSGEKDFTLYETPFNVNLEDLHSIRGNNLEYYLEDEAGNRSEKRYFPLSPYKKKLEKPRVGGVENKGIYTRAVHLLLSAPGANRSSRVRYELTTDGSLPPPVSDSSMIVAQSIRLDSAEGETLEFRIRARTYGQDETEYPSEEATVSFTIDKTPPDVPVIEGVVHNGHYHEDQRCRILSAEGQIYYTVINTDTRPSLPDMNTFKKYEHGLILATPEGGIDSFWIAAFTVDKAGNQSRETGVWKITIDKKLIYVSPEGNDLYEGTRNRPFKTLDKALSYSSAYDRKFIHCALGEYQINRSLILSGPKAVIGGFNPVNWKREGFERRTIINTGKYFPKDSPLIEIIQDQIHLEGFEFYDSHNVCPILIKCKAEEVSLKDSQITLINRNQTGYQTMGLMLTEGSLEVSNCRFTAEKLSYRSSSGAGVTLLSNRGGELSVKASEFIGPSSSDNFTAINLNNRSINRFSGINVDPGNGKQVRGIYVKNSELSLIGCKISSGIGKESAAAVELINAKFTVKDCIVEGHQNGNYTTAVLAEDSNLFISKSRIRVSGRYGASGLSIRKGEITMTRSQVESSDSREFLYLVEIHDGRGYFANNILAGSMSGDTVCAILTDCSTDWFNNTVLGGTGRNLTVGFMLKGKDQSRLINNIITRKQEKIGTAIYRIGPEDPEFMLLANNLYGWKYLLKIASSPVKKTQFIYGFDQIENLNKHDRDLFGGTVHKNISEPYAKTFRIGKPKDFHLAPGSKCVNAGIDLSDPRLRYRGPKVDMDGQERPAPLIGIKPLYDIGADELY